MKKTVRGLMIAGIILMIIGVVMFGMTPKIMNAIGATGLGYGVRDLINPFVNSFLGLFSSFGAASWYFIGASGAVVLIFIIHLIIIIAKKRPSGLVVAFLFLIFGAIFSSAFVVAFTPDYIEGASDGWCPLIAYLLAQQKANADTFPLYWLIILFAEMGIAALGFVFILIADIVDMVYIARSPKPIKGANAKDARGSDVVVVRDDAVNGPAPTSEEIRQIMHDEMSQNSVKPAAAESEYKGRSSSNAEAAPAGASGATAITGPLLVQYINTYSPEPHGPAPMDRRGSVPLSEIKENVTGEKSLKAEDIRKIIKEELDSQKKEAASQPLIVTVPAPSNEEEKVEEKPVSLSADDIRAIVSDELKSYFVEEEKGNDVDGDIVVEPVPEPELSADDIRSIIREELAADKKAADEEEAAKKAEEDKRIAAENERKELEARHQKELEDARAEAAEATRKAIEEENARKAAEEEAARKAAEEEKKNTLTADQIRQIIVEELSRKEEEKPEPTPAPAPAPLSADDIRAIIADELKSIKNTSDKPATPVTIIVREPLDRKDAAPVAEEKKPEPAKEEPKPEPVAEPAPVKEEPEPEPEPVKEDEPEPTPEPVAEETRAEEAEEEPSEDAATKRVVGQVNPNLPPHEKIIRIPFQTRMAEVDDEIKNRYNELKSEIMSYGVKSRVSNSGDTFRLHKVTFVKMTIAGKGLKLYMALDPKDYANTTLPIQDAGHKGTYKDIPLVFKVKSDLSMRRAKQLIADVMSKNGLTQGEIEKRDWIAEISSDSGSDSDSDED